MTNFVLRVDDFFVQLPNWYFSFITSCLLLIKNILKMRLGGESIFSYNLVNIYFNTCVCNFNISKRDYKNIFLNIKKRLKKITKQYVIKIDLEKLIRWLGNLRDESSS